MYKNIISQFHLHIHAWAWCIVKDWNYRNSFYNYWRLYSNNGAATIIEEDDGRIIRPQADDIILIPPMTRFSTRSKGLFSHLYIHFEADPYFKRIKPAVYQLKNALPSGLNRLAAADTPAAIERLLLLKLIADSLLSIPEDAFGRPEIRQIDSRVNRAVNMMMNHLDHPLDSRTLSRCAGVSVNSIQRLFMREFSMPPQQYQRLLRIDEAQRRLRQTDASIDQIAADLGFADRYHFSKVFKQIAMVTPAAYRKNKLDKPAMEKSTKN